ncbi:MAG TPA: glutathione S-transferase family protein, partial [Limnobacter sp.]|nr:glutathione S-transferase family protein [Limnobacter sp.]
YLNDHLGKNPWFCGEHMTGADVMMIFPLEAAASRAEAIKTMPNIAAYVKKVHALPAYKKALEVGGPYDYA